MCHLGLTDEELKQGMLVIEELQRGKEEVWTLYDFLILFILPFYITKLDWDGFDVVEKILFILFWWPLYYTIYAFCIT